MDWSKYLHYDANTGLVICKDRDPSEFKRYSDYLTWRSKALNKPAGTRDTRYVNIHVMDHHIFAHHFVWELFNGPMPNGMVIDHIDGNGRNNRIENLRLCKHSENCRNRSVQSNSKSRILGVSYRGKIGKWTARIKANDKYMSLGCYRTKGEAAVAYAKASIKHFGKYSPFISR